MNSLILFESLIEQLRVLKNDNINVKDIDACLCFCNLFMSDNINHYINFINKFNFNLINRDSINVFIEIACSLLGIDDVHGNEKIIFDFFVRNLCDNGYVYHLTNASYIENIRKNGMNTFEKSFTDIISCVLNLNEKTKNLLFPFDIKDIDYWYYSMMPNVRKDYELCQEWFNFFTKSFFGNNYEKNNNCDYVIKNVISIMENNGESIENKNNVEVLIRKYWNIYKQNYKMLVLIPLVAIYPCFCGLSELCPHIDNTNKLYDMLSIIITLRFSSMYCKTNKKISFDALAILDLNSLEFVEVPKISLLRKKNLQNASPILLWRPQAESNCRPIA